MHAFEMEIHRRHNVQEMQKAAEARRDEAMLKGEEVADHKPGIVDRLLARLTTSTPRTEVPDSIASASS